MGAPQCSVCGCVGRVGNALLGHPPEPLVCLRCTKAADRNKPPAPPLGDPDGGRRGD